jgi:hypothetical protein
LRYRANSDPAVEHSQLCPEWSRVGVLARFVRARADTLRPVEGALRMPSSSSSPDKFQREIDDIIRLAERRLERQSVGYRVRRNSRRLGSVFSGFSGFSVSLPRPEVLGGWGLALLMFSWLAGLLGFGLAHFLSGWAMIIGLALLIVAIITSLSRGSSGGSGKSWRGERISYGSPYGSGLVKRIRRLFRG